MTKAKDNKRKDRKSENNALRSRLVLPPTSHPANEKALREKRCEKHK